MCISAYETRMAKRPSEWRRDDVNVTSVLFRICFLTNRRRLSESEGSNLIKSLSEIKSASMDVLKVKNFPAIESNGPMGPSYMTSAQKEDIQICGQTVLIFCKMRGEGVKTSDVLRAPYNVEVSLGKTHLDSEHHQCRECEAVCINLSYAPEDRTNVGQVGRWPSDIRTRISSATSFQASF